MKIEKKSTYKLEKCYSIAPLHYNRTDHILVAAEKTDRCLLFDLDGNYEETIWEGPGGTMSMVQIPGGNGAFLATEKFYSPDDSKEAGIILAKPEGGKKWSVKTIVKLPHVHRFDILTSNGISYLLASTLCSEREYKDDWSSPGKVYACQLPEDLNCCCEEKPLELTILKEGLYKNHGYCKDTSENPPSAYIASENGIFRFTPPLEIGKNWNISQITADPASDMRFADFDRDGELEMLTISPFHGDQLSIYKKVKEAYAKIKTFDYPAEFAHAVWGGDINGKPVFIVGHRKGSRNLIIITCDSLSIHDCQFQIIDRNVGPANVMYYQKGRELRLISANREINEIAFYKIYPD